MTQLMRPDATAVRRVDDVPPTLTDSQVLEFCKTGILALTEVIPDSTNDWVFDYIEDNCRSGDPLVTDVNALLLEERFVEGVASFLRCPFQGCYGRGLLEIPVPESIPSL